MNERSTRSDYAIRLERVFSFLADHLDDTLDLARLADVACMSPYHFHRIYHAMQGETAAETVRRLRLHRAAVELITGELPVPRIARRAGYGSQEAFTERSRRRTAFHRHAIAPRSFRHQQPEGRRMRWTRQ
jgi:AraC family transcriptional regulator